MIARYDLKHELITFDFFSWLVMAVAYGATEVVFGTREYRKTNWSDAVIRKRFETIIAPGPALAGLPCREGDDGESFQPLALRFFHFVSWSSYNTFPRLKSPLSPGAARYTVTLRQQAHKSRLNSNEVAWRQFADEIGAVVIEDFDVKPISLHERMALYAGAEMNFGVASGPMQLIALTNYPCMVLNFGANADYLRRSGLIYGDQAPWCNERHLMVWEQDDLATIKKVWRERSHPQ